MIQELDLTVTNTAAVPSGLPPFQVSYLQIYNPDAAASLAFTFNGVTPVVNGAGITLLPCGSATYDSPGGTTLVINAIKMISSVASQKATIIFGGP